MLRLGKLKILWVKSAEVVDLTLVLLADSD